MRRREERSYRTVAATATKSSLGEVAITTMIIKIMIMMMMMMMMLVMVMMIIVLVIMIVVCCYKERQGETAAIGDVNRKEEVTIILFQITIY